MIIVISHIIMIKDIPAVFLWQMVYGISIKPANLFSSTRYQYPARQVSQSFNIRISATGYYIAEGIMFGFTASFFTSVSGSIVQSGGSAIMFVIIGTALDKIGFKTNIAK